MPIRNYQSGDETVQARIYNEAAGGLPGFKPATADEVARRYRTIDPDPQSKFYAEQDGAVVGYVVFNPNGRISYPWCLPDAQPVREPLLDAALAAMRDRGLPDAWAAYRADWADPVLRFLEDHGFQRRREMINYVAELDRLPHAPPPDGYSLHSLRADELPKVVTLGRGVFIEESPDEIESFLWNNPYFGSDSLFGLSRDGTLLGAGLVVADPRYADPSKIDPAMPCFRLGAFGTERERHKRVNGMVSLVFRDEAAGEALLAEAARRVTAAGLTLAAAQAPSDQPDLVAFYDRHFHRQGSFPILARPN